MQFVFFFEPDAIEFEYLEEGIVVDVALLELAGVDVGQKPFYALLQSVSFVYLLNFHVALHGLLVKLHLH